MATITKPYEYDPLDPETGAFRLLKLKASTGKRLEGELIYSTILAEECHYKAVSYTWGELDVQDVVHIGDSQLPITYNLSLVLRDVRLSDQDRVLWNDATCVNQQDIVEQGQQVQQMGEIYRGAAKVLFCIGRPTELTDFYLKSLRGFWNAVREDPDVEWTSDPVISRVAASEELMRSKWDDYLTKLDAQYHMVQERLRLALGLITTASWFERIWIAQEVLNAREGVVYCGRSSTPAAAFGMCTNFIATLGQDLVAPAALPIINVMSGFHEELRSQDLLGLMRTFLSSKASNRHDRIYVLLSIATDTMKSTSLIPDYTITQLEVVSNTVRHMFGLSEPLQEFYPYMNHDAIDDFFKEIRDGKLWKLQKHAAGIGQTQALKAMLDKSFRLTPEESWTHVTEMLLHAAAKGGHKDTVKMLLDHGPDISPQGTAESAPLAAAVEEGHVAVVKLLISRVPAMIDAVYWHATPLMFAILWDRAGIYRLLLASGHVDLKQRVRGMTTLDYAARFGDVTFVEDLLATGRVTPFYHHAQIKTTLAHAAWELQEEAVKAILAYGKTNFDPAQDTLGDPVRSALRNGRLDIVEILLGDDLWNRFQQEDLEFTEEQKLKYSASCLDAVERWKRDNPSKVLGANGAASVKRTQEAEHIICWCLRCAL